MCGVRPHDASVQAPACGRGASIGWTSRARGWVDFVLAGEAAAGRCDRVVSGRSGHRAEPRRRRHLQVQHHFPDGPSICSTSRQQLVGGGCGRTRRASARPLRIHRAPALSRNAYRAPAGTRAEKDDLVDADDEDYLSELESSDDHEAEAGTDEPPGAGYAGYRPNVGMVVFNRHLQVWMGRRSPLRVR